MDDILKTSISYIFCPFHFNPRFPCFINSPWVCLVAFIEGRSCNCHDVECYIWKECWTRNLMVLFFYYYYFSFIEGILIQNHYKVGKSLNGQWQQGRSSIIFGGRGERRVASGESRGMGYIKISPIFSWVATLRPK